MYFHPIITHFPIAGAVILPLFELSVLLISKQITVNKNFIYYLRVILTLFICITASGSFFSGLLTEDENQNHLSSVINAIGNHYWYARISFILSIFLFVLSWLQVKIQDESLIKISYKVIVLTFLIITLKTGYEGGELVFKHAVGVEKENSEHTQSDLEHQ